MTIDQPSMLPDGSNPEGVDPFPPLRWRSRADFADVVVHGPALSPPTTKLRCLLLFAGIPFVHEQHMNARSRGFKPNTDYRRVPILDVAGRQVNDSAIILKYLLPAIDLEFDEAWEDRIVLELDTSFKLHCTSQDWARLAIATMGAPRFLKWVIGPVVRRVEAKQARNNIANSGLGHKEVDEVAIASDFKSQMQGAYFHGATPGHVDLSLYGFLSGYLHAQCPISTAMVNRSGLASWVDSMNAVVPLEKLFPSR